MAEIVSELLFNHACNKNIVNKIQGLRHFGSEIGYFRFFNQVSLDFLKNKTSLGYIGFASLGDR